MTAIIELPYPVANNRMYRNVRGHMVLSEEGKQYKVGAGWLAKAAGVKVIEGNVEMVAVLHPRQNKDGSPSKTRLDLDGIFKVLCDSLNGVGYKDDKQITRIIAEVGSPRIGGAVTVSLREIA